MSSDIPGFYFDPASQRYYRLSSESSNVIPSARAINDRARQDQLVAKQMELLKTRLKRKDNKRLQISRLSLFRQREYGQISNRKMPQLRIE